MLSFYIIDTVDIGDTECFYSSSEYSLYSQNINYRPQKEVNLLRDKIDQSFGISKKESVYIFTGDITMQFNKNNGYFNSLDSYTNKNNWIEKPLDNPHPIRQGILKLVWENEEDVDYKKYSNKPTYIFDTTKNILQIDILDRKPDTFVEISKNIICGISSNLLSSFYLLNLQNI